MDSRNFVFRTLNRKPNMMDSIIAVYRKGAKEGEMPLYIGPRRDWQKKIRLEK